MTPRERKYHSRHKRYKSLKRWATGRDMSEFKDYLTTNPERSYVQFQPINPINITKVFHSISAQHSINQ